MLGLLPMGYHGRRDLKGVHVVRKFRIAINLKAAKVLGLTIRQAVLARAEEVTE
jgi:hypothetical protein